MVEFLVDKGVERSRLTAIGRGEKLPWAPNDTEEGRAQNRRVIFHIEGVSADDQKREERRQLMRARKAAHQSSAPRPSDERAPRRPRKRAPAAARGADVKTPFLPGASQGRRARTTPTSGKAEPTTGAKTSSTKTTPRMPGARPFQAGRDAQVRRPQQPGTKKPAPRPENPNAPKTLRDLLRLPER